MSFLKKIISWFIPEQKQAKQQTGTNVTKASSDTHIKVIYGTRKTEGTIVFMNTTNPDDDDDVKNDLLHIIIIWCEGGVESIDDILLNDISITDSKFNAKDGGRWAYAYNFTNGMAGLSSPHLKAAGWDGAAKDHRLDGLACTYLRLEWSIGDNAPFTGIPDTTAIIKGRRVKNLETGVTEYSENPAYCTFDYLTHPIFGKDLQANEYDLDSFKLGGRIANTAVPKFQGSEETQPLFTCNAVIDTGQSVLDNTEILSKSMRALMPIINGKLTLIIEQDDEPTPHSLSENDFDGKIKYDEGSKSKRYNRVIVEYIDKELSYSEQDAVYPEPDSELADQWLAEDNGVLLEYRFKVSSCTDYYEARQMARILAMLSRESLSFTATVAPIALRYTIGDVIPINHKKLGWVNKPFRLIGKTDQPNGQFTFNLREHQPYIYNWLNGNVRPPIPSTSLPDPRNIAAPVNFSSTLLNDGHVKVAWESVYSHFDIQIYKDNALILSTTSVTPAFVITALDAGNYEMDVRAASKIGFRSAWVSFGFSVALPAEPSVDIDAVTYNTITLSASVTGASLGTTFEWQFLGQTAEPNANPNTASGYNYIYTGLVPDTEYSFKVRTKNLSGVSPWVDVAVKTSLSDLLDYIDDIPLQKLSEDAQTLIEDINTQVDRLRPETEDNLPDVLNRTISELNLEKKSRVDIERGVFNLSANYTAWRQEYEKRQLNNERLIDASVYIDPDNGTIVNRAFAYTEKTFSEANLKIDGVNSRIELEANRITQSEGRLTDAESKLLVQGDKINAKVSFTEMQGEIASAIEALKPAYSWQFNSNDEGFIGADSHSALGYVVSLGAITSPAISYTADENPMFRLRVRLHENATWLGQIKFNDNSNVINVPAPVGNTWQTLQVDATGTDEYTGVITMLEFNLGECDIDFIEVGKRGANDLALNDITLRTTTLENDIDGGTGIMAQYATTAWVDDLGYQTQSNVDAILNTFDTTYKVSATLQEFSDNDTLKKANNAEQFINGAEAYIKSQITSFNAAEDGIDSKFSNVDQKLDALDGSINQNIVQVRGLDVDLKNADLNTILAAANDLLRNNELQKQGVKLAIAETNLKANANDLESVAQSTLDLFTIFDKSQASFNQLVDVVSKDGQALVTVEQNLKAKIEDDTNKALATAQEYTRTAIGYCVDAEGNITSEKDAVVCVDQGGSWVQGPLAEYISNLQISDGESTASIKELRQLFTTVDGKLVARGGWTLDNNGRVTGVAGYNDGDIANLDFIGDVIRQGAMVGNTFVPTSYVDNTDPSNPQQVIKGRLVLGDGHKVESLDDIKAQDGQNGDTIYEVYQYSVNGSTNWHDNYTTGDIFRRTATVTNGVRSSWRDLSRITGVTPEIIINPDGSYTITNGTESATIFDGENAPIPTVTKNGDTVTIESDGETVTISDGVAGYTPIKGIDYIDGKDGSFVSNVYKTSSTGTPKSPTGGTFNGTTETFPNGWQDTPYFVEGEITYISTTRYSQQSNGSWLKDGWSKPVEYIIKGDKGDVPIITTNQDGSYTITNGIDSVTITDGTDAPIPTAIDNGNGTYTITDGSGNSVTVSNGENGYTPVKGIDYIDGRDGSFVSNIYTTSSTVTPSKPVGGSFNGSAEVIPSGYQDAPYFEEGKVTYISSTRYRQQDNGSWVKSGWSTPSKYIIKGDEGPQGVAGKDSVSLVAKEFYGFINDSNQWEAHDATLTNNPTYLTMESTTNDPRLQYFSKGMSVIGSENPLVSIRMRSPTEVNTVMQIYYITNNHNVTADFTKQVPVYLPANQWVSFEVDMRELTRGGTDWVDSTITGLRIDPVQLSGISLDIDYILVGRAGAAVDGTTTYTWIRYADGPNGGGISNDPTNKEYIGFAYNKTTATESTNPVDYTWSKIKGTDGVPGAKGADGKTTYTWIAYSDNANGSSMYQVPNSNTKYIGIAVNKTTATESTNPANYTWSLFKGADGAPGPQGVRGPKGVDGTTTYTWIRYADTSTGGGINNNPTGKKYIGFAYNKTSPIELNDPNLYTWSLIKGTDGVNGAKGADGTTYYTWIAYSDFPDGTDLYQTPNSNTLYIGIAPNRLTPTESNVKGHYTWSRFKGEDGKDAESIVATLNYDFTNGLSGWNLVDLTWEQKATYIELTTLNSSTQLVKTGLNVDGLKDTIISVRVRNKGAAFTTSTQVFYATGSHGYQESYKKLIPEVFLPQNEWVTINFDMRDLSDGGDDWVTSEMRAIRIDFPRGPGIRTFDLDFIAVGKVGAAVDGSDGADGSRGSIEVQIATATGVWSDATANSSVPGSPVEHDRVTIYKASNPAVQTIKRYNGSAWVSYTLYVHGSALIEDTLDANVIRAGTRLTSPRIDLIGDNFMKIELASGFGPDDLWYWMGPKIYRNGEPDLDNLTKANAKEWKDRNANSFTVGTFVSGAISNSVSTTQQTSTPLVELAFTSNGGNINFAVSYSYHRNYTGPRDGGITSVQCPSSPVMTPVSGTIYLERNVNGSWVVVQSKTVSGRYSCANGYYEGERGTPNSPYRAATSSSVSFTDIESPGSGYQLYRVRGSLNNYVGGSFAGHYLSVAASE